MGVWRKPLHRPHGLYGLRPSCWHAFSKLQTAPTQRDKVVLWITWHRQQHKLLTQETANPYFTSPSNFAAIHPRQPRLTHSGVPSTPPFWTTLEPGIETPCPPPKSKKICSPGMVTPLPAQRFISTSVFLHAQSPHLHEEISSTLFNVCFCMPSRLICMKQSFQF